MVVSYHSFFIINIYNVPTSEVSCSRETTGQKCTFKNADRLPDTRMEVTHSCITCLVFFLLSLNIPKRIVSLWSTSVLSHQRQACMFLVIVYEEQSHCLLHRLLQMYSLYNIQSILSTHNIIVNNFQNNMMVYSYIFYYIHILMFFVGILYILQPGDTCKLFCFKFIFFKTIDQ